MHFCRVNYSLQKWKCTETKSQFFVQIHTFAAMFYLVALLIFVAAGLFLILMPKNKQTVEETPQEKDSRDVQSDCCGAHEICEFDEYKVNEELIEYFDDEELDVLRNVREDELTPANIDELRDVLYTLKPGEIKKWLVSLSRRHIHLPPILQQEARQLIAESL